MRRSTISALVASLVFSGLVAGDLRAAPGADPLDLPGVGDDTRRPTGTPFALPEGVTLAGPIVGAPEGACSNAEGATFLGTVGSGQAQVCVRLKNMTGSLVRVELPPGLVIVSASETFQHGLIVERTVVRDKNGRYTDLSLCPREEVVVMIAAHCMNPLRDYPGADGAFSLGPVTDAPPLRSLVRAAEGKAVSWTETELYMEYLREKRMSPEEASEILASIADSDPLPAPSPRRCNPTR